MRQEIQFRLPINQAINSSRLLSGCLFAYLSEFVCAGFCRSSFCFSSLLVRFSIFIMADMDVTDSEEQQMMESMTENEPTLRLLFVDYAT